MYDYPFTLWYRYYRDANSSAGMNERWEFPNNLQHWSFFPTFDIMVLLLSESKLLIFFFICSVVIRLKFQPQPVALFLIDFLWKSFHRSVQIDISRPIFVTREAAFSSKHVSFRNIIWVHIAVLLLTLVGSRLRWFSQSTLKKLRTNFVWKNYRIYMLTEFAKKRLRILNANPWRYNDDTKGRQALSWNFVRISVVHSYCWNSGRKQTKAYYCLINFFSSSNDISENPRFLQ